MAALDKLHSAAAAVDVIDTAGRIIAHPHRFAPSATAAEVLALAHAVEKFWAVALEAELLVRALKLPITGDGERDTARDHAIQTQVDEVTELMAAIRGATTKEEETDGSSHS